MMTLSPALRIPPAATAPSAAGLPATSASPSSHLPSSRMRSNRPHSSPIKQPPAQQPYLSSHPSSPRTAGRREPRTRLLARSRRDPPGSHGHILFASWASWRWRAARTFPFNGSYVPDGGALAHAPDESSRQICQKMLPAAVQNRRPEPTITAVKRNAWMAISLIGTSRSMAVDFGLASLAVIYIAVTINNDPAGRAAGTTSSATPSGPHRLRSGRSGPGAQHGTDGLTVAELDRPVQTPDRPINGIPPEGSRPRLRGVIRQSWGPRRRSLDLDGTAASARRATGSRTTVAGSPCFSRSRRASSPTSGR